MFQISMPFPEGGLVYDYTLDDGGASRIGEDEEEEEKKKTKVCTPFGRLLFNRLWLNCTIQSCLIIELFLISCMVLLCRLLFIRKKGGKSTL